jgi:hypothetical protein
MNTRFRWAQIDGHEACFLYVESQIVRSSPSHVTINCETQDNRARGESGESRQGTKIYSMSGTQLASSMNIIDGCSIPSNTEQ